MLSKNKVRFINSLTLKKNRIKHGQFIAEGIKIVQDFANSEFHIEEIYYTDDVNFSDLNKISQNKHLISYDELKKISQLKTSQGILALVNIPEFILKINELLNSLTIVLDDIQDPGNLGTIIRIANWFGIKNIICSENSVDVFNPKVIQASMGSLSGVKVHYHHLENIIDEANKLNIPVYGTFLEGENIYTKKLTSNGIIVFGNESKGISKTVEKRIESKINIPAFHPEKTKTDSLNIAVATALVCAEFRRGS